MSKRAGEKDTLRDEYDLRELNLIGWGAGYKSRPAVGKATMRRADTGRHEELAEASKLLARARPHLKAVRVRSS